MPNLEHMENSDTASKTSIIPGEEENANQRPRCDLEGPKAQALVSRLQTVFRDIDQYRRLLRCRGSDAQRLLDSFQLLLDSAELDIRFRRSLIVATQRISKKFGLYPACYKLPNIVEDGQHPITAGGFADIYKGDLEGQTVCIKAIRIYRDTEIEYFLKHFSKEAILWGQLSHPNVLPVYGLYHFQTRVCLVSPWMKNGDINQYLQHKPEAYRLRLAIDVAEGLSYLHENGIIHGDLKGPNILISDAGTACIADFGISSISDPAILAWTSHSSAASMGGSVRWQAPELFDMENDQAVANTVASDVYAWSCVCYEIYTGDIPFVNILRDSTVMLQIKSGARPSRPPDLSPAWNGWGLKDQIWTLMQDCWSEAPSERPSIKRVIERLTPELIEPEILPGAGNILSPAHFRARVTELPDMLDVSALDRLLWPEGANSPIRETTTSNSTLDFDGFLPLQAPIPESSDDEPSSVSQTGITGNIRSFTSQRVSHSSQTAFKPPPLSTMTPSSSTFSEHRALHSDTQSKSTSLPASPIRNSGAQLNSVSRWVTAPRLLVVDDDVVIRMLCTKFLQTFGCTVDVAVDGVDAVDKVKATAFGLKYDLVLMDIVMPNLDGLSATSRIRKFDNLTPILAMTSASKPKDIMTYHSYGMVDILAKPFNKQDVLNILEKHLVQLKVKQHYIPQSTIADATPSVLNLAAEVGGMTRKKRILDTDGGQGATEKRIRSESHE